MHSLFGVDKRRELHAVEMYKGRGRYCDTPEQERRFGTGQRAASGRIMLTFLARSADFQVITLGTRDCSKPKAYARLVAWLEDWAVDNDTYLLLFYDGHQGLDSPSAQPGDERRRELWETALRDAAPYREAHRELNIDTRRVVEDVIMQDSRYGQLIQAVDLIAYGAYHRHLQDHPELSGATTTKPLGAAIIAYMKLQQHWPVNSDHGIIWLD